MLRRSLLVLTLAVVICSGCKSESHKMAVGFDRMAHPEWLPYMLPDGTVTKQAAAYDLTCGNADGSYTNAYIIYLEPNNEAVMFDEYGPGCLYRQQINIWWELGDKSKYKVGFGEARLRYYFDNETTPRIDMTVNDYYTGKIAPYNAPFTFRDLPHWSSYANTYYPLPFAKRLKVTLTPPEDWSTRGATWYQYTYLAFPTTDGVKTWTGPTEDSPLVRKQWTHLGTDPKPTEGNINVDSEKTIEPGQAGVIFDRKGQASIAALKLKLEPYNQDTFYNTNILITWDDQPQPSISLPLSYLFGGGGKDFECATKIPKKIFKNLYYGFDCNEHSFYSYWPMPFWTHAKIEIQNNSKSSVTLSSHIELKDAKSINYPKNETGYFCAKRTVDADSGQDAYCNVLKEQGKGMVVGTNFFTEHYSMDGDEFTYMDSSHTPQVHGSGTEDDHNQGWGGSEYQKPLWGAIINGYQGSYRLYTGAPYVFYDNIKINFEYSLTAGTKDSKSDVVYYYYKSPFKSGIKLTDELDVATEASERSHNYRVESQTWEKNLSSCYDGYEKETDYDCVTDGGRAFNGSSEFTVKLDPRNNGVRLRKRINRFENGVQTATVYVDGKKVTERPWHILQPSTGPAKQAWFDSDFQIPASYTKGKKSIKIRMEYVGSTKGEINEFYYWVYCHQDQK